MKFDKLPDQLPETVAELTELAAAITAEINVFQARSAAGHEFTAEEVERAEYVVEAHKTVTAERDTVAAADQTQVDKLNDVLARAAAATKEPEAAEAETDTESADSGAEGEDGAAAEVVAEAEAATAAAAEVPETVTAAVDSGRPVQFAGAVRNSDIPANTPTGEKPKGWEMLQSAPKYAEFGNEKVGFGEIAQSIASVASGSVSGRQRTGTSPDGNYATQAVARLTRPTSDIPAPSNEHEALAVLDTIGRHVPGQGPVSAKGLVAAGGWCAPSEQVYSFCSVTPASNLLSLPDFPFDFSRGGVRVPISPDVSALLDNLWHFTEAELEAVNAQGDPTAVKKLIELPCPDQFLEWRLEAIGWAAKAGILMRQAWPEAIENALEQIQVAHQHRVSQLSIGKMVAGSGTPIVVPPTSALGATSGALNGLALQADNLRFNKGLKEDATIEGVAPVWFRGVLRADLALREGKEFLAVTNAEIDSWLAVRNIYLQYVVDWQTRGSGQPGNMATVVYPATVDVMLYPAGTWFRTLNNVITLGVQYPLQQLQLNQYTHVFTEDSLQVGKRCDQSIIVRLPICVSGAIGARQYVACNTPTP
ncbi:major capsid protein [Mycobacteroides abscessus]|uniref:major capsid protein n=1 Tax=Mycobacteroides abscessus TaxID=36809 RepID=UPI002105B81F|nr:major capsid protein [Mycobacteroides abscessus]